MPENTVTTILTMLPNLAVAVWVIINYQKTIAMLLDNQQKLIDSLLKMQLNEDGLSDTRANP